MRLIDKDEILNLIGAIVSKFPEEYDEKTYKMIRREIRDKNREVKAIPIEWIKNWCVKNYPTYPRIITEELLRKTETWRMIEDWEDIL